MNQAKRPPTTQTRSMAAQVLELLHFCTSSFRVSNKY